MSDTWCSALLDWCNQDTMGKIVANTIHQQVNDVVQEKILFGESSCMYRFRDGRKVN